MGKQTYRGHKYTNGGNRMRFLSQSRQKPTITPDVPLNQPAAGRSFGRSSNQHQISVSIIKSIQSPVPRRVLRGDGIQSGNEQKAAKVSAHAPSRAKAAMRKVPRLALETIPR